MLLLALFDRRRIHYEGRTFLREMVVNKGNSRGVFRPAPGSKKNLKLAKPMPSDPSDSFPFRFAFCSIEVGCWRSLFDIRNFGLLRTLEVPNLCRDLDNDLNMVSWKLDDP